MEGLVLGLSAEIEITVSGADTAARWGSGLVPVFSTPSLVGLMESTAVKALSGQLPTGQTTVGGHIDVRHLAPTPVGMRVKAKAELTAVNGKKLTFKIQAWDEIEQIGEALHDRFLVDKLSFITDVSLKEKHQ
jgi:fluoroacetyl-CoA thioesterase